MALFARAPDDTRRVHFCFDNQGSRDHYRDPIRALSDPVIPYLPAATYGDEPDPEALNVRYFRGQRYRYDVFASHGIADKGWRRARFVKHFSYICVSGPAWIRKYQREGLDRRKLLLVGYPKIDTLVRLVPSPRGDRPRVLWAPTVLTQRKPRSSWPALGAYLDALDDRYDITVSAHPKHSGGVSTTQALVDADVVIADTGSTIYEAWALDKPVVFPSWLIRRMVDQWMPRTMEQQIYRDCVGYHVTAPDGLVTAIEAALANGITDTEQAFIEGVLPRELRGVSGQIMAHELLRVYDDALAQRRRGGA